MPWWKRPAVLYAIWVGLLVAAVALGVWHIQASQTPEMTLTTDQRAQKLGTSVGILFFMGLGIIWCATRKPKTNQ